MLKGKLEIIVGKYGAHKLCLQGDPEHKGILEDIPSEQAFAYLDEIVRRWNAIEELLAS